MIKKLALHITGILFTATSVFAQKEITLANVTKTINVLASDEMKGRKIYSVEIDKAADFIASEYKKAGLKPLAQNSFLQTFSMITAQQKTLTATSNGKELNPKNILVITAKPELNFSANNASIEQINAGDNLIAKARQYITSKKDLLIKVDTSFTDHFFRLTYLKKDFLNKKANIVFVLGDVDAKNFSIKATHAITEKKLTNVVGVLPGKKRANEYVIFSGHYDHLGVKKNSNGDSIYNGANDDASGITAVIELAKYYKSKNNNERSLIFVAFTAEEEGGFGSQYFSQQLAPEKVMAMFNIEMIGTDSKWGKNSAYITGFEKTNMGEILQKNLKGTGFEFHPDPYPKKQLFYRSDNKTLAQLGVPAHTISTSKMDIEPHYHKVSDEVKTLDLVNMTEIIKSIGISAQSIISGKDTPTRVNTSELK